MISLSTISLKRRRLAATYWAAWRNDGIPSVITAKRATELTGLPYFAKMEPRRPVRLVEVALRRAVG